MSIKNIKIIIVLLCIIMISTSSVFGASYVYNLEKNIKKDESSISTSVSMPVFNFESEAQVLMEASTGKIIYANNEDEKLLPASVTKIMTLLLIMEQIDSRKTII